MAATKKILFLSPTNPHSPVGFSGTLSFSYGALKRQVPTLDVLSLHAFARSARIASRVINKITSKNTNLIFNTTFARSAAQVASAIIKLKKPDVIIAMAASPYVAYLEAPSKIIYCTDATYRAIASMYESFGNLPKKSAAAADEFERRSLAKADHVVLTSEWARDSAIFDYGVSSDKISVFPFGANLDPAFIPQAEPPMQTDMRAQCNLLYVGFDWKRKGGDIAVAALDHLARHARVRLDVVGNAPPRLNGHSSIVCHGALNKNVQADVNRLVDLFRKAHFLILPTQADATPIVFNEASAFAVPSLTYDVGGTSSVVHDGINGYTFPLSATAADFAGQIQTMINDIQKYEQLRHSTFEHYQRSANWTSWAQNVLGLALKI